MSPFGSDAYRVLPDYATAASPFVREFQFEVNHDTLEPQS